MSRVVPVKLVPVAECNTLYLVWPRSSANQSALPDAYASTRILVLDWVLHYENWMHMTAQSIPLTLKASGTG